MSILAWFWVLYISLGLLIMMEAIVEAWTWFEYETWIKILVSIISILLWPIIFFMN